MKQQCDKCGAIGWLECEEDTSLIFRCMCGAHKLLYTTHGGIATKVVHTVSAKDLPNPECKTGKCLQMVLMMHPKSITTGGVCTMLEERGIKISRSDVATRLMLLQHKDLVSKSAVGKGKAGGSTWTLTPHGVASYNLGAI